MTSTTSTTFTTTSDSIAGHAMAQRSRSSPRDGASMVSWAAESATIRGFTLSTIDAPSAACGLPARGGSDAQSDVEVSAASAATSAATSGATSGPTSGATPGPSSPDPSGTVEASLASGAAPGSRAWASRRRCNRSGSSGSEPVPVVGQAGSSPGSSAAGVQTRPSPQSLWLSAGLQRSPSPPPAQPVPLTIAAVTKAKRARTRFARRGKHVVRDDWYSFRCSGGSPHAARTRRSSIHDPFVE